MHPALESLFRLDGHTAVVTGGSSGIGKAMATALCRAGAEVVLLARDADRLERVAEDLRADGGRADWLSVDVADREAVHAAADELLVRPHEPDILVNAAGVNPRPPMDELTEQEWDLTMAVNLHAPFLFGQRFGPRMADRGWGRIVHIASQQSFRAFGNSGGYGVSKSGLAGLTRSQAEAWSSRGVCVNAVAPGFVHTPLTEPVMRDPARGQALAARTMMGRNGVPEDFAGVAVFLASDASAYLTGQVICVDGGFSVT